MCWVKIRDKQSKEEREKDWYNKHKANTHSIYDKDKHVEFLTTTVHCNLSNNTAIAIDLFSIPQSLHRLIA